MFSLFDYNKFSLPFSSTHAEYNINHAVEHKWTLPVHQVNLCTDS